MSGNPMLRKRRTGGRIASSISLKIFFTFFITMLVMIASLGLITYQIAKQNIVDKVKENSEQAVVQTVKRLDLKLEAFRNETFLFTDDKKLQEDVVANSTEDTTTFEGLQAANRIDKQLATIVATSDAIYSAQMLAFDPAVTENWYQSIVQAEGKPVWINTRNGGIISQTEHPLFGLGRLIKNNLKNRPIRVLLLELKGAFLQEEMKALETSDGNSLYLVDHKGVIIETTNPRMKIGQTVDWLQASARDGSALDQVSSFQRTEDGQADLFIQYPSSETGWTLVNQIPIRNLVRAAGSIWRITAVMVMLAILLSLGVGASIARRVGRPLSDLSALMKRSEDGDLDVRANVRSTDEIGRVSYSFNKMMDKINELMLLKFRTAQLEMQISLEAKHRSYAESLSLAAMSLSSTMDKRDLLQVALTSLHKLLPYEQAEIYTVQGERMSLEQAAAVGSTAGEFDFAPAGRGALLEGIGELDRAKRWMSAGVVGQCARIIFTVPIKSSQQDIVFALSVCGGETPSDTVLDNVFAYLSQVAVVMENAQQYHEMTVLATTDGLTGVYNRRHFLQLAEKRIRCHAADGRGSCLVLYDIDHFKKFNDQHGHLAGDEVLKQISRRLAAQLGPGDLIGRYGGEEFIVLLSDTPIERAVQAAEALRTRIAEESVTFHDTALRVTASFGVACVKAEQPLLETINRADTALYAAKSAGRNCVVRAADEEMKEGLA